MYYYWNLLSKEYQTKADLGEKIWYFGPFFSCFPLGLAAVAVELFLATGVLVMAGCESTNLNLSGLMDTSPYARFLGLHMTTEAEKGQAAFLPWCS